MLDWGVLSHVMPLMGEVIIGSALVNVFLAKHGWNVIQ